jgi:hypothetical protein
MGGALVVLIQEAFQGRDDTETLNSATFSEALNTDFSQAVNTTFRLRFEVNENAGGNAPNLNFRLQSNKNSGGWVTVTTTSFVVQIDSSSQFTDGDATTQVIGDGSFVASEGLENTGIVTGNVTLQSESTEIEFCLTIVSGDVDDGDTIEFQVQADSADLDTYAQVPTLTVVKGVGRRIFLIS